MPNYAVDYFNATKNQQDPFNIDVSKQGFESGFGENLKKQLAQIFQQQLGDTQQQATESATAQGDFNPNLSKYYATKGAQEAQSKGMVDAMQTARADEFNRFNVKNAINNFNLQKDYFNLQKQMYEDSQPSDWERALNGIGTMAGFAIPFLSKGGKVGKVMHEFKAGTLHSGSDKGPVVKDRAQAIAIALSEARKHGQYAGGGDVNPSNYFQAMYNGGIPASEINSTPEPTGDNTLIKAQTGEVIQSNPAGNLVGRDNLKLINEAGQMANNLFPNLMQNFGQQKPQAGNMGAGMNLGTMFKNLFSSPSAGGGTGGGAGMAYAMGGGVDPNSDPYGIADLENQINKVNEDIRSGRVDGNDPNVANWLSTTSNALAKRRQAQQNDLQQQQMQQQQNPTQQMQPPVPEVKNQGGAVGETKKITIETKPY